MKKLLLFTLTLSFFCFSAEAQVINVSANWPNENWSLSGDFDSTYLYENPTNNGGSSSFSFDDDDAGSSSDNTIGVDSPVIDLSAATTAGETDLIVYFQYVYRIWETTTLNLQYWDANTNQWFDWGNIIPENSGAAQNYCASTSTSYTSATLDITSFTSNQLQNFKYRIFYDDNTSYGYGFCINSPLISSSTPPACTNVSNLAVSNIEVNSAEVNWNLGSDETSWEVAIQLATSGIPASGANTTDMFFNFTSLTAETNYVVYVRANCSTDGFSNWQTSSFTTGADLSAYPVTFTPNPIGTTGTYDRALVDLNGDFLDDVVSISSTNINVHYQLASGGFNATNITTTSADNLPFWSLAAGDFDANGYNDLLYGGGNGVTFMQANDTGTGYTEISGPEYVFSQRSNFVDINTDGHLDAFVCHDVQANVYYINDGSGNLNYYQGQSPGVVTNGLGTIPLGGNYGTVWIDFDNDRDMDLFIAKCRGGSSPIKTNELWRNDGNGVFINIADSSGWYATNQPSIGHNNSSNLGDAVQTWSSAWADFDNDGDMDVYVGASSTADGNSKLMRNNGDGTFTDITAGSGVLAANLGIENAPADFDNDGYVDILSNGDILFNNGDFTFTNFTDDPTDLTVQNIAPSGAIGDANNDGFLDVFADGQIHINNANSNNWIKINTIGTTSNINGIGARVEITTNGGTQIRDVRSGEGFRYMSSLNTHFGIGTETVIDNITVYWPSGVVDFIPNPTINDTQTIVEGSFLSIQDETLVDMSIYPNPVEDQLQIKTTADITNKIATVFDINGRRVLSEKLESNTLNVSNLSGGVYFLRLESFGKVMTRKFIKK